MSKIFDALKKSEGRAVAGSAAPPPSGPPEETSTWAPARTDGPRAADASPARLEPVKPRSAEITLNPSGLDLPLEFVRELGTLRGTIDQLLPGRAVRTILFAGAISGEGSSTVAAAFARLLAEDERLQVVLVDADLRSVERRLPSVDDHYGFAGVLDGRQTIEQALVGTSLPNLAIVPGGTTADSPLRLCTTNNLHAPLDWLRHHYHYVVIDGPPVLDSPEMVSLATQVDGIVLVVRAARTKREIVQRAIEAIDKFQGRVLGAILNRQQYVIPDFIYRRL